MPNCRNFTHYRIDSAALPSPITEIIQYPLTVLSFPLPSDIITNVTVTLTALGGGTDIPKHSNTYAIIIIETIIIMANCACFILVGTTDVQNLTVNICPEGNCISVSIVYVEGIPSLPELLSV